MVHPEPIRLDHLPRLLPRPPDSHKGDYGRALLVGGSRGMAGAIGLAGMATLRAGAGLVTLAVPEGILSTVAGYEPSYMTLPVSEDSAGRITANHEDLRPAVEKANVVACGPGLGQSHKVAELVSWLYKELPQPLVLDADGLNNLAERREALASPGGPRLLTPHPGEFTRLIGGQKLSREQAEWLACELAAKHRVVIVLKGHGTLVTDGARHARNTTGNAGMATGGSGDILTGILTGLLCLGFEPFEAARMAVFVHGVAGDLAAEDLGQTSLVASDLLLYLPRALQRLAVVG